MMLTIYPVHSPETRTLFVAHKTITRPSTFVKFGIKFVASANLTIILTLSEPLTAPNQETGQSGSN